MNPMTLLQLRPMFEAFRERHPKFVQFFGYASDHIGEDSVLELSITDAQGKKILTNIRLSPEDIELFRQVQSVFGQTKN